MQAYQEAQQIAGAALTLTAPAVPVKAEAAGKGGGGARFRRRDVAARPNGRGAVGRGA
ncbi:hypothetical protein JOS77_31190 [Chromobacterium haemolyticum]|nr:hypothetical protein JOS77_31190 [Chromobacterium haemolyticum]